jgi:hypothetical protein
LNLKYIKHLSINSKFTCEFHFVEKLIDQMHSISIIMMQKCWKLMEVILFHDLILER